MAKVTVDSANEVYMDFCEDETIKILHVDDEVAFLTVAKQCLEEQSKIQVDTALSAKEALKKLNRLEYDAVVCDYPSPLSLPHDVCCLPRISVWTSASWYKTWLGKYHQAAFPLQ